MSYITKLTVVNLISKNLKNDTIVDYINYIIGFDKY
jgi:hypothetical protein